MPPAARITDTTAHGGIVTVGFPTVIIGGMPASRIGDMHTCPMFTGLVPHVGGPFILGSFTVLVGSMPQSKVGDTLVCVGPPDTLVMGCPTVQVGVAGGGGGISAILAGLAMMIGRALSTEGNYPRAELQPDGTIVTQYSPGITIKGSPAYQAAVISDLNTYLASDTGQNWQDHFDDTGHHITIEPIPPGTDQDNGYTTADSWNGSHTPGTGADSTIQYNPSRTSSYYDADGNGHDKPQGATLGHEMTHALHNAEGTNAMTYDPATGTYDGEPEEAQTIGYGPHGDDPTENDYLNENGLPDRSSHAAGPTSTYADENGQWWQRDPGQPPHQISTPPGARPSQ